MTASALLRLSQIVLPAALGALVLAGGQSRAQQLKADDIACQLDPNCQPTRSFIRKESAPGAGRIPSSGGRKEQARQDQPIGQAGAPPSVNLSVNFAFDSANLTPEARTTLDELGHALRRDQLAQYAFLIEGHTDARGTEEYNLRLSQLRAEAVKVYLIETFGIDAAKLASIGHGKSQLLDPTRPTDGVNRRVHVVNTGVAGAEEAQGAGGPGERRFKRK